MHDVWPEIYKYIYIGKIWIIQQTREGRSARQINNFYIRGISIFWNDLECSLSNVCYILEKKSGNKTEKNIKNEQRSKDAAAKQRPNTSGVYREINNYYVDIYN